MESYALNYLWDRIDMDLATHGHDTREAGSVNVYIYI